MELTQTLVDTMKEEGAVNNVGEARSTGSEIGAQGIEVYDALPEDTLTNLNIGDLINGRYRVIGELGRGGLGTVFLCRDTRENRKVALKVDRGVDGGRWITAEIAAYKILGRRDPSETSLNNTIVDVMAHGGNYIIMEVVPGKQLAEFIDCRGNYEITDYAIAALNIIRQVFRGLEYAHGKGILHADICPRNILVSRYGLEIEEVTIVDWGTGIAHQNREPNVVIGKTTYMSPEQARSEDLDPRSDIYSAGISLYFLLTGRRPFQNIPFDQRLYPETSLLMESIYRRSTGDAFGLPVAPENGPAMDWMEPVRGLAENFRLKIRAIVEKMTASDKEERYGSAFAARLAVEAILDEMGNPPPLPPQNIAPLD
ncbi:hypothetical protein A3J44_06620 [candidate division WOR-1 bacterium RIFCSPHIGHO2_02_FULL_45_12]|nr:MAG: hypothetical protein A3J44_06620 [candidate division WOR-1 bacterium RIFCSPHIGHO2_02_FULL_45_12]